MRAFASAVIEDGVVEATGVHECISEDGHTLERSVVVDALRDGRDVRGSPRSLELDREYIRTWNLKLDAKILLKTIGAVIQGSGD